MLHRTLPILALLALAPVTTAQSSVPGSAPFAIPAPPAVLASHGVNAGTLQNLTLVPIAGSGFETIVSLDGQYEALRYFPHSVRSRDFKLLVSDANGIREIPAPAPETYRGTLLGNTQGEVAASVHAGQLDASIWTPKRSYSIKPLKPTEAQLYGMEYLVFEDEDIVNHGTQCGGGLPAGNILPTAGSPEGQGNMKVAEIAIDADLEYYQRNGSNTTNVMNAVDSIMNRVDTIYMRDVFITYDVTTVIIRTSRVYTWTGSMNTLLGAFGSRWQNQHGSVRRDLAHLFTGKGSFGGVIGIAWSPSVCSTSRSYGVSKAYSSNGATNGGLVAHETGHNFGSNHCDGQVGGCYIMCSGLGGCDRSVTRFGTFAINSILAYKATRGCLSDPPQTPAISSLSPNTVTAAVGDTVTVNGTALNGVTSLKLNGVSHPFTPIDATSLSFDPPTVNSLLPMIVTVENATGTSNGAILSVVPTDPPRLAATPVVVPGIDFDLEWGGPVGTFFGMAQTVNDNSTINFSGFDVLANAYILFGGGLVGAGTGSFSVPSASIPRAIGLIIYTQIWTINPTTTTFKASPFVRTVFF